jgi:hypothetical protein
MPQERRWNSACVVTLGVVAAAWLWFLFAYAHLFVRALNERKPMAVNYSRQQLIPTTRWWASVVALCCAGTIATGALGLMAWIALALLGY